MAAQGRGHGLAGCYGFPLHHAVLRVREQKTHIDAVCTNLFRHLRLLRLAPSDKVRKQLPGCVGDLLFDLVVVACCTQRPGRAEQMPTSQNRRLTQCGPPHPSENPLVARIAWTGVCSRRAVQPTSPNRLPTAPRLFWKRQQQGCGCPRVPCMERHNEQAGQDTHKDLMHPKEIKLFGSRSSKAVVAQGCFTWKYKSGIINELVLHGDPMRPKEINCDGPRNTPTARVLNNTH